MAVFTEPTKWTQTLGQDADVVAIPDTAGETDPSIDKIFPSVFSILLANGGRAIPRSVLNGLFKLLGDWIYYIQNGGVASYSASFDYSVGSFVKYNNELYRCIHANGASTTVKAPTETAYWSKIVTLADVTNAFADINLTNVDTNAIYNLQNTTGNSDKLVALHNNIFRGNNLLNYFSSISAIQTAVSNGDFSKIYIGDYIPATITYEGTDYTTNYRVAGINTFKNYADTALTRNHLVLIPDRLFDAQMNTSNTTSGGYVGSRMYTTVLPALLNALAGSSSTPFYGKIISHRELFPNAENNWAWYDNSLCLLSEMEAYGSRIFASYGHSIGFYAQMPLFKLNPDYISKFNRTNIWLRSVTSSASFCVASSDGDANGSGASGSCGVRPRFLFG